MTLEDIFPSKHQLDVATEPSDEELNELVSEVNPALQRIQDLVGRSDRPAARIRFPRGYLREAGRWRFVLPFVRSSNVRNNVAYTLMMHDVQTWVLKRTDLAGHAHDMVVKGAIAVLGGVAEALLVDATSPPMGRRQKLASRLKHLQVEAVIAKSLGKELLWLWEVRNRQHLHELTAPEFDLYTADDHPRAEAAVAQLIVALNGRLPAAT